MRPDRAFLSAYLDGEVPERFVGEIEAAIEHDPEVRADYEELRGLRSLLARELPVDVAASATRSWAVVQERIGDKEPQRDVWHRRVSLPLPVLAAAATVLLALVGVLAWALIPAGAPGDDALARGNDVDVTIRVDGSNVEHVLRWLVDQNKLGEVNIELPEQRFEIIGEPALVKPARYEGETGR
ncbi:MAG: anti-sigma factor family protein [Spirochaetota bacterium]